MASLTSAQSPTTPATVNQHAIAQHLATLQNHKPQQPTSPPESQQLLSSPKQTVRDWTGFRRKTLWDWLQFLTQLIGALAVPLVVVLVTNILTTQQQHIADVQHQNEINIAIDQQREAILKTYLDDMSTLLLNNKLRESAPGDEIRNVARIKTLTTLRQLDGTRKGILLQFLQEAGLIEATKSIINLTSANLSGADLSRADLRGANLSGAFLSGADLRGAGLGGAFLIGTDLIGAHLSRAYLAGAFLAGAYLSKADLSGANLRGAFLAGAYLSKADLSGATLREAVLFRADLSSANLNNADLFRAYLSEANLSRAVVTYDQLALAYSLQSTTLPDGSTHQ